MNRERRIEQLEFELAERGADILELRNQLAEAQAEIERLKKRADVKQAALVGVCENCPNAEFGPEWCKDCDIYIAREGK